MRWLELPIRRPVATSMFFLGLTLLGGIGAWRIPVELFPNLTGDQLFVSFHRPGSEPEVVEREILLPLEARVAELPRVAETWGEVRGAAGTVQVRFEPGADLDVSQLELQRLAAELAHDQPRGTWLRVQTRDTAMMSRFAMIVQVLGGEDRHALRDLVEERIAPRLASVPGVAQVFLGGSAGRQVTVTVDADRCAATGVTPEQVTAALGRTVSRLTYLGDVEEGTGRTAVLLDGRPPGLVSLGELRIVTERPVLLRHVAEVEVGAGRERALYRVNGQPAVGMFVFQEEGANLVRLGRALRRRVDRLRGELGALGLDLVISLDGAEIVEEQIERLRGLALTGFVIALVVLYLFLRQWRAVAVVAVAVPVSLLVALAFLYLAGQSINLITLFGLAVGIGMLVDNSVVVYEAVQRRLERGTGLDDAAIGGVHRTVRAILAASLTTAVVFLPLVLADFEAALIRSLVGIIALSILLPLAGSLLVAVGLVPLLARRLAAPAAVRRLAEIRERRRRCGGLRPPDRLRAVFSGFLVQTLRRPAGWIAATITAVVVTVLVALPWVLVSTATQPTTRADQVQLTLRLTPGKSATAAAGVLTRLEEAARGVAGVERVETLLQETDGSFTGGSLTVHFADADERPGDLTPARIREVVHGAANELTEVEVLLPGEAGTEAGGEDSEASVAALFGAATAKVVLSGPESAVVDDLAAEVRGRLESIPEIAQAWIGGRRGQDEIRVLPDSHVLAGFGLTADQLLPVLRAVGREGLELPVGMTQADGRELPLLIRRRSSSAPSSIAGLRDLRLMVPTLVPPGETAASAAVLPLGAVATFRTMPPPRTLHHHNGRRERTVSYRLGRHVPTTGPARAELEEQIAAAVRQVHRPAGTTVEVPEEDTTTSWFKRLLVPAVLLLFVVLAVTFESPTLPVLVLVSLPLTLLGATWALVLAGMPLGLMALVGALSLLGLTVNPAILLVDRMQQQVRGSAGPEDGAAGRHGAGGGRSAGAAALAAVRERARPVLMTTATTVAGLWPLALVSGRENEIWPPFATIVMGGLVASTLLTLLVMPVGFVFLRRLDELFGRLGPWVVMGWIGVTAAIMVPLVQTEVLASLTWQLVTGLLVAGLLLGVAVLAVWRDRPPEPRGALGPPVVEARFLSKVYGLAGPVGRAWRGPERFARRALAAGGRAFDPREARDRLLALGLVAAGTAYLMLTLQGVLWRLAFLFVTASLAVHWLLDLRRARGHADEVGRVHRGGPENLLGAVVPWLFLGWFAWETWLGPKIAGTAGEAGPTGLAVVAAGLAVVQIGRRTARLLARGELPERVDEGRLRHVRTRWRRLARRVFGLDLPRGEVRALSSVRFRVDGGMVGILGPNGAGKTTLLRQLAGILDPSRGRIVLGDVHLDRIRRHLGRWVGYLPQDTALPPGLTAREYLEYWSLLYEIEPAERAARIDRLLREVGLAERADERIGSYSGGMRQRVAVARTLLRLPPVIIVDEPTVGLDPRERIRFRNLLSRLAEGRVVLFSTHVVEDVAVACERVLVLAGGRLVFDGPPAQLADAARGRVWEVSLDTGEQESLASSVRVADQVPEGPGRERLRLISESSPHPAARTAEPTLEEGYLLLVGAS